MPIALLCMLLCGCFVIDTIRGRVEQQEQPSEEMPGPTGPSGEEEEMMMPPPPAPVVVDLEVRGYFGEGLVLRHGTQTFPVTENGTLSLGEVDPSVSATVETQPRRPAQTCAVDGTIVTCVSLTDTPRVLFSDLTHGPRTGGENDRGAFITLFGLGFGSDATVTVGGVPATVVRIGDAAPRGLETIVVQVGPTTPLGSQPIIVNRNGVDSEAVYYDVRSTGTITFATSANSVHDLAVASGPGDVIYLRAGTYSESKGPAPYASWIWLDQNKEVAIVAYPGETVNVNPPATGGAYHTALAVNFDAPSISLDATRITLSKLSFGGDPKWMIYGHGKLRVVGNRFTITAVSAQCDQQSSAVMLWERSRGARIFGNYFDTPCTGFETEGAAQFYDLEIAYNEVTGRSRRLALVTSYSDLAVFDDVRVHSNFMHDEAGARTTESQLVAVQPNDLTTAPSVQRVLIYNNIVRDANREAIDIGGGSGVAGTPSNLYVLVSNNSTYENNDGTSSGEVVTYSPEGAIDIANNIMVGGAACINHVLGNTTATKQGNNAGLCEPSGAVAPNGTWPPSIDLAVSPYAMTPPLTLDAWRPTGTQVIDKSVVIPEIQFDFFGRWRKEGGAPDIGAVERYP